MEVVLPSQMWVGRGKKRLKPKTNSIRISILGIIITLNYCWKSLWKVKGWRWFQASRKKPFKNELQKRRKKKLRNLKALVDFFVLSKPSIKARIITSTFSSSALKTLIIFRAACAHANCSRSLQMGRWTMNMQGRCLFFNYCANT